MLLSQKIDYDDGKSNNRFKFYRFVSKVSNYLILIIFEIIRQFLLTALNVRLRILIQAHDDYLLFLSFPELVGQFCINWFIVKYHSIIQTNSKNLNSNFVHNSVCKVLKSTNDIRNKTYDVWQKFFKIAIKNSVFSGWV